jgi:SAM-dependent methyltransferase
MSGLEFTKDAARRLEDLYLTRDVVAQRAETIRRLAPSRREHVLDVGCGPGFLCESIAKIVGSDGAVVGVDISSDLIDSCRRRSPPQWLSYTVGDATQLAQPDASFDASVSRFKARGSGGACRNGLGHGHMAFAVAGSYGIDLEIVGIALCPSTSAQVAGTSFGQCRFPAR